MIALALLLLVVVAAIVLVIVVTGSTEYVLLQWAQLGIELRLSALVVFLLGVLALLLTGISLALFRRGARRGRERRRELKRLRESDAERSRAAQAYADQERAERARSVPPATEQTTDASGAAHSDSSWYDDNPPQRQ
jgi:uncharacterized protein HemY